MGSAGLIVRSVDGGRTWVQGGLGEGGPPTGERVGITGHAHTATERATFQLPSLIASAYAAEEPPKKPDGLAEVDGLVLDPKGIPLPEAFVDITEEKRGRRVAILESDEKGRFQLPLPPGYYFFTVFHARYGREEKLLRELTAGRVSVELALTAPKAGKEEAATSKSPLAIQQTPVQAPPEEKAAAPQGEAKSLPNPIADGGEPAKRTMRGKETSEEPQDFSEDLVSVYFSSEEADWAVARSGEFLYTADAGQHWVLGNEGSRSEKQARASRPTKSLFGWYKEPSGRLTTVRLPPREIGYPDGLSFEVAKRAHAVQLAKAHIASRATINWAALLAGELLPTGQRLGWGVTSEGAVKAFLAQQAPFKGQTVSPPGAGLVARGLWASDSATFWVVGENGVIFLGSGDQLTTPRPSHTASTLHAICFLPDDRRSWIAGADGTILHTTDGGGGASSTQPWAR